MQLKEFTEAIDALEVGQKAYLKPAMNPPLNAYHQSMKNKILVISAEPKGGYSVRLMTAMDEKIYSKVELEKAFHDKVWYDYTIFDLMEDYTEFNKKD